MKIKIEIDIPGADYAALTKWLKHYGADNTIENTLEHEAKATITKWLPKARRHTETGKDAFQRFKEGILDE